MQKDKLHRRDARNAKKPENSPGASVSLPQGQCADCAFARRIESPRGSQFVLCERSRSDAAFPKYPRLPVIVCAGYERKPNGEGRHG